MKRRKRKNQHAQAESRAPGLSLCMIVKDEAQFLARCLDSVKGLVDEVVVGDTGSSGESRSVAEGAGATVIDVPWSGDFAAARNAVLDRATGDWVLALDCDEVLSPKDHAALRRTVRSGQAMAYRMTTRNYARDPHRVGWQPCKGDCVEARDYPGWFPTTKVRVFKNDPRIRFEGALHELVEGAVEAIGGAIADCPVPVHHYGYVEKERSDALYAEAGRKKAAERPHDPEAFYQLALSLRDAGDLHGAKEAIARCVDLVRAGHACGPYLRMDFAYLVQGDICRLLGDDEGEEAGYRAALEADAGCYQALNNLGALKQRRGAFAEALDAYKRALALAPGVDTIRENIRRIEAQVQPAHGGRLSLCMIARNEGHRLGRCLDRVKGLVDEIVVVDTGSTDDTVEVARQHGAKIGYFEWCDDFASARNASLALATGDWIMWLDPDDLLPVECHAKIREAMRRGLGKKIAYYWILDNQGYEPVQCFQMRLFPNLAGAAFSMPIHEQITPSLAVLGVTCEVTDIRVAHTGYSSPEVVSEKQVRYLGIMEKWLQTHPDDYIVRSHAAMTHYIRGDLDRAIDNYRRILDDGQAKQDRNLVIATTAVLYLGRCYMRKQVYDQALPFLREAEKMDDQYAVTHLTLGECYTRMNRPKEALAALSRAQAFEDQVTFSANDPVALKYAIRFFMGQNLETLGQLETAATWYVRASEIDSRRGGALGRLSSVYRRLGRTAEAVAAIEAALEREPDHAQHRFNRGTFYLEAGDADAAVQWFEKALGSDPDMPEPYLNLGYVARRSGEVDKAEAMYRQALSRNSGGYEAQANLAHLLLDQERFAEAGPFFEQVRAGRAGLLDITLGLCVVRAIQGDLAGVGALLSEALQAVYGRELDASIPADASQADLAALLAECGRMLMQQQLAACAKLAFLAAHKLVEEAPEFALLLADVHQALGEYWKAVALYEGQIRQSPTEGALFRKLGTCYDAMGVPEAAQMCRTQAEALQGVLR